jgi:serine/threonine protein kinase
MSTVKQTNEVKALENPIISHLEKVKDKIRDVIGPVIKNNDQSGGSIVMMSDDTDSVGESTTGPTNQGEFKSTTPLVEIGKGYFGKVFRPPPLCASAPNESWNASRAGNRDYVFKWVRKGYIDNIRIFVDFVQRHWEQVRRSAWMHPLYDTIRKYTSLDQMFVLPYKEVCTAIDADNRDMHDRGISKEGQGFYFRYAGTSWYDFEQSHTITLQHISNLIEITLILHAVHVCHRDLHSKNIAIDDTTGQVRLIDFDLCDYLCDDKHKAILLSATSPSNQVYKDWLLIYNLLLKYESAWPTKSTYDTFVTLMQGMNDSSAQKALDWIRVVEKTCIHSDRKKTHVHTTQSRTEHVDQKCNV